MNNRGHKKFQNLLIVWMVLMGKGVTNRHLNNLTDKIQHINDGWIQANKIKFKYINFNNEVENTFFVNNMCELYGNYNRDGNLQQSNYL